MACTPFGYLALFTLSVICLSIAASVVFWLRHTREALNNNKMLYYPVFAYFVLQILVLILWSIADAAYCFQTDLYILFEDLGSICFALQYIILILIFYLRLSAVFAGTSFELTRICKTIFAVLYISFVVMAITIAVLNFTPLFYTAWQTLLMAIIFFIFLALIIMVIGLFIYKLVSALRNLDDTKTQSKRMVKLITKTFLLTLASILSAGGFITAVGLLSMFEHAEPIIFIAGLLALFDLFTNSLSIALGFRRFEKYYMKICKVCHIKCIGLCAKLVTGTFETEFVNFSVSRPSGVIVASATSASEKSDNEKHAAMTSIASISRIESPTGTPEPNTEVQASI
eukprot:33719_1